MDTLSDKIVVTRKPHRCFACLRKFEAGTKMKAQTNIDNEIYTVYSCETCQTLMDKFHDHFYDDGDNVFPEGCVSETFNYYKVETPEQLLEKLRH